MCLSLPASSLMKRGGTPGISGRDTGLLKGDPVHSYSLLMMRVDTPVLIHGLNQRITVTESVAMTAEPAGAKVIPVVMSISRNMSCPPIFALVKSIGLAMN